MKKETFTEKLIKRTYGISGPLDEHKNREADRIGNKAFMVLFYLMIFGNLIPFVLAYKYPQVVAFGYPIIIFLVSMVCAIYVSTQTKKTGITAIDPDMLNQKEKKQLRYPGLKAGLVYGVLMFFGIPLLNYLSFQSRSFYINPFRSLLFRINDATCRLASHSKSQRRSRRQLGGNL